MSKKNRSNPVEMNYGTSVRVRPGGAGEARTPRLDHPDDTEMTRMGFTLLGILYDLEKMGDGE